MTATTASSSISPDPSPDDQPENSPSTSASPVEHDTQSPAVLGTGQSSEQKPFIRHDTSHDSVSTPGKQSSQPSAATHASGAEQNHATTVPAVTNPAISVPSSKNSSHLEPRAQLSHKDKERDKSARSAYSPTRVPSRPPLAQNPSSSKSKANGTTKHKSSKLKRSKSLFSRFLHALVPCVSSSHTHSIELSDSTFASVSKEKQPSASTENAVSTEETIGNSAQEPTTPAVPENVEPAAPSEPVEPSSSIPDLSPPDGETIAPPTPPVAPRLLPLEETEGVTSGAVQPPGSTGGTPISESQRHSRESSPPSNASGEEESEGTSFTEDDDIDGLDEMDEDEDRLIMNGGAGIPIGPDGIPKPLLPPIAPQHAGRKCLILDLDETLVHSSFKSIQQADYVVPVEIEYNMHNVYVIKRPGVDKFLKKMGEIYEIVVFTASLSKYADPVLDKLDIHQVVSHRLFRESCYNHRGNYVKDLSQLGRPVADTIILDNSPASYIFHPNNAVPVSSWFNDPHDTELPDLVPFLTDLAGVDDVRGVLDGAR